MHDLALGDLYQVANGQRLDKLGRDFQRVWDEQAEYNRTLKETEGSADPAEWTQTYLMGLVSEIDEVLRELHWKRHRKGTGRVIESNMGRELADLFKFVMSLWQTWGFEPEDLLSFVAEKNEVLEFQWHQDQDPAMPHKYTILLDMDGTVSDYRAGLTQYLQSEAGAKDDRQVFYQMDLATGLDYEVYHHHKDIFEETGGYRTLPTYPDGVQALRRLKDQVNLCVVTARPKYLARSWADTYYWLKQHVRVPDRLWLAEGERLKYAKRLREQGYQVVCWEDAPIEALRYAEHGFHVFMRNQSYNDGVYAPQHPKIHRVFSYPLDLDQYFMEAEDG
jgi:hypothetical protein